MINSSKTICVFDLETTGVDVSTDRIIQIASSIYPGQLKQSTLINPGVPIPAVVSELTGITDEMVADAPRFEDVAERIHAIISKCDLVGYNLLNFDVPLLWEEFHRAGIVWDLSQTKIVDAGNIFKKKEPRTLVAALKTYCQKEHINAHEALADVDATAEVLEAQLKTYPDLGAMTFEQLADWCSMDEFDRKPVKRIDLAGLLIRDTDGVARYTHRRVRGVAVKDDPGYAGWMLRSNFSANTKLAIESVLLEIQIANGTVLSPSDTDCMG